MVTTKTVVTRGDDDLGPAAVCQCAPLLRVDQLGRREHDHRAEDGRGKVLDRCGEEEQDDADHRGGGRDPLTWLVAPMSSLTAVRDPLVPTGMPWVTPDGDLGDPEREQLLVGVDDLVVAGGEGAGGEDRVGEANEEDGQRSRDERRRRPNATRPAATNDGRPLGTAPVTATPWEARSSAHEASDAEDHEQERARDALADPGQEDEERQPASAPTTTVAGWRRRGGAMMSSVSRMAPSSSLEIAHQLAELTEDQHDGDAGDVPDQHRLREVVGDPAEANEPGREEHEAHQQARASPPAWRTRRSPRRRAARPSSRRAAATVPSGPTTTRGADPKTAYATTGSRRAYRPALTGTPASSA